MTRLLRLIGPILKNWLIKVCEEVTKHATGRGRKYGNNTCKHHAKYTGGVNTHTPTTWFQIINIIIYSVAQHVLMRSLLKGQFNQITTLSHFHLLVSTTADTFGFVCPGSEADVPHEVSAFLHFLDLFLSKQRSLSITQPSRKYIYMLLICNGKDAVPQTQSHFFYSKFFLFDFLHLVSQNSCDTERGMC